MHQIQSQSNEQGLYLDLLARFANADADAAAGRPNRMNANVQDRDLYLDTVQSLFYGDEVLNAHTQAQYNVSNAVSSIEHVDMNSGMVDSLTLTDCKLLEKIFDEEENQEIEAQEEASGGDSERRHRRSGVQTSHVSDLIAHTVVETKTYDGKQDR